jgi:hypothetical protein
MSFKWNYIWQFSMLFGVFCQVTWHMVCKTCFCYCLGIQVGLLQMQLHHPFLGLGLHHPFFWARQDYGTPLHNQSFTIPKEKKKHTHTHISKWCSNFVWLMVGEEWKKSITSRDQVQPICHIAKLTWNKWWNIIGLG